MDQEYEEALHHAKRLENDIKNLLDDKNHPVGRSLLDESRRLVSEIDARRDPRSLEERIKSLLKLLHHAKEEGEAVIDQRHILSLHHGYEHLQRELREFENY